MVIKRRKSLPSIAKMRKPQQKRKGKRKRLRPYKGKEPYKEDEAVVTFIEKFDNGAFVEGELSPTRAQKMAELDRVQFYLDHGRLDVAEVFDHLGTCGLQYESKPGIWHDLKRLYGKSANIFKNKQKVYFRRTGNPQADEWFVEGDTRKIYRGRVSRLCYDDGTGMLGTAIRFENRYGLVLTALHCCTEVEPTSGEVVTQQNLVAFGTPVDVVHRSDKYDLAFLLLKTGPYMGGFRLGTRGREEVRGRKVHMLSFPGHMDNASGFDNHKIVVPTEVHGHIANLGPKERELPLDVDGLATYTDDFAASPGGAVTINSKVMIGMHIRKIQHEEGETILPFQDENNMGRDHCSGKDPGESSNGSRRNKRRKKKRKLEVEQNIEGEVNYETSVTSPQRDSTCQGYLSTYLSASRIRQEYDDFVEIMRVRKLNTKANRKEFDRNGWVQDDWVEMHPIIRRRLP